jgi:hypothetical protein
MYCAVQTAIGCTLLGSARLFATAAASNAKAKGMQSISRSERGEYSQPPSNRKPMPTFDSLMAVALRSGT